MTSDGQFWRVSVPSHRDGRWPCREMGTESGGRVTRGFPLPVVPFPFWPKNTHIPGEANTKSNQSRDKIDGMQLEKKKRPRRAGVAGETWVITQNSWLLQIFFTVDLRSRWQKQVTNKALRGATAGVKADLWVPLKRVTYTRGCSSNLGPGGRGWASCPGIW